MTIKRILTEPNKILRKISKEVQNVGKEEQTLMDDMVDTANTLCEAASSLKRSGAIQVKACCTHPVLSGDAIKRIQKSELDEVVVTNSIPLSEAAKKCSKIRQISISGLLAESIRRIATDDSVSSLFVD